MEKGGLGEIDFSKYYHQADPLVVTRRRLCFCLIVNALPQSQWCS